MGIKKYIYINGLPTIELIVTSFMTLTTFCLGKVHDGSNSSLFNYLPFLILTIIGWIICLFRIYKFVRVYLSEEVTPGVVLSISGDMVRIGCMNIAYRSVIQVLNIHSSYAQMLKEDEMIKFKTHGRWLEILNTNKCYLAYKKGTIYESYMIFERLTMKLFKIMEYRGLI